MEQSLAPESISFEQSLYTLIQADQITREDALAAADSQNNLLWFINNAGKPHVRKLNASSAQRSQGRRVVLRVHAEHLERADAARPAVTIGAPACRSCMRRRMHEPHRTYVHQLIARRSVTPDRRRMPGVDCASGLRLGLRRRDDRWQRRHQRVAAARPGSSGFRICRPHRCRAVRAARQVGIGSVRADAFATARCTDAVRPDMKSSIAAFVVAAEQFIGEHAAHRRLDRAAADVGRGRPRNRRHDVKVVEALRARGETLDYCIVGEPTSVDALGDTIKNGRRGSLIRPLDRQRLQGHVAYPQLVAQSGTPGGTGARRAGSGALGRRRRILSADHVPGFEHARRHRRAERDPGHLRDRLQPALRAGVDRRIAAAAYRSRFLRDMVSSSRWRGRWARSRS